MKFEKFLKSVGTHGRVIVFNDSEKWLVCDGVGMLIPHGVENVLGTSETGEYADIVHTLAYAEFDEPLELTEAVLLDPAGNAKAIYRIFESDLGSKVGICNADYGLLEKSDRLGYGEVEIPATDDREARTVKFIIVYDDTDQVRGYITGISNF